MIHTAGPVLWSWACGTRLWWLPESSPWSRAKTYQCRERTAGRPLRRARSRTRSARSVREKQHGASDWWTMSEQLYGSHTRLCKREQFRKDLKVEISKRWLSPVKKPWATCQSLCIFFIFRLETLEGAIESFTLHFITSISLVSCHVQFKSKVIKSKKKNISEMVTVEPVCNSTLHSDLIHKAVCCKCALIV